MPRPAARDTPAQREIKIMKAIAIQLDELDDPGAVARVITWMDDLIEVDPKVATRELRTMQAIATQFTDTDSDTREIVVRWLIRNYGNHTRPTDVAASPVAM